MGHHPSIVAVVVLLAVLTVGVGLAGSEVTTGGTLAANSTAEPAIVAVYPNPITSGDAGEYVVLSLPDAVDLSNATLSDGTDAVSLANVTYRGRVAFSDDPATARNVSRAPIANVTGLQLANGGETLTLRIDGEIRSRLRYADAPEGELGVVENGILRWQPLGATDFDVAIGGPGRVRAFVLPDAPAVPTDVLRSADDRILLAGYTLTSERIATELIRATERGAEVRVLLEGEPVGGRTRAGARQLDRLVDAGVDVRMVAGPYARVTYHHAKYAVADDRAIVMTENWKPSGTGGNGSRGWGVVTGQPAIVANLTATFEADVGWRDAVPWEQFRRGNTYERGEPAVGSYPTEFEPERVTVNRTELLVTPDNAGDRIVRTIDDADESIDVIQASLGEWDGRLPTGLRRAASRGVEVRILLSSAWYSREENEQTVERFREWAERTGAPLSAKLAEPGGRYAKIHAKGAVVDDETVLVGSLNWNGAAATSNREVVLLLHGSAGARYYGKVFDADWTGGGGIPLPIGVIVAVVGCLLLSAAVLAKIRFEGRDGGQTTGVGPPADD